MENDYLWDKTGEDKEIEQLEKTLQVFRYQESSAPLLPKKVVVTEPKFSLFSFRFALSFAACIALLLGGFMIWQKVFQTQELAKTAIEQNYRSVKFAPIQINKNPKPVENEQPRKIFAQPRQISYREKISVPVVRKPKKQKVVLTEEEQYAYNQLMLALSITGSKLKEVQDKANGVEDIK